MRLKRLLFRPALAPVLRSRAVCGVIIAIGVVHITMAKLGLPGIKCAALEVLNNPCPGCGITRGAVALLQGDIETMLAYHAFAPMLVFGLALIGIAAFLPTPLRDRFAAVVERVERTGIVNFVLIAFVLYWVARMCFYRRALVALLTS